MITGPDVSRHQGPVDWYAVARSGHAFAFVKATEGVGWIDPQFRVNWRDAHRVGLRVGAYHYAKPNGGTADARAEADHYLNTVGDLADRLPAVLDLEDGYGNLADWALAWLDRVEQRTGKPPIVYSFGAFWRAHVGNDRRFARYPFWYARYNTSPGAPPAPWTRWTFWQHTSSGVCAGVQGRCDLNQFNGGIEDLDALVGGDMTEDDRRLLTEVHGMLTLLTQGAEDYGVHPTQVAASFTHRNVKKIADHLGVPSEG